MCSGPHSLGTFRRGAYLTSSSSLSCRHSLAVAAKFQSLPPQSQGHLPSVFVYLYSQGISPMCLCLKFPFFFFFFLELRPWYIEVPRLGVKLELQLHHRHSNTGSELHLQPIPHLMATLDPWPTERGQGWNPQPHGSQSDSFLLCYDGNSWLYFFWKLL